MRLNRMIIRASDDGEGGNRVEKMTAARPVQSLTSRGAAAGTLRVNLIWPFLAIKHASRVMAEKGKGSIICTASVAGLKANAG